MFVITWNGKTTVLSGWRAWLVGAGLIVAGAIGLIVFVFLLVGLTVTMAAVLLFVIPLVMVLALVSAFLRSSRRG